jgi:hypothetical protein
MRLLALDTRSDHDGAKLGQCQVITAFGKWFAEHI